MTGAGAGRTPATPDRGGSLPDWGYPFRVGLDGIGRLGFNWLREPADRPRSRAEARGWFLQAIFAFAPDVLSDLANDPFALYQELPVRRYEEPGPGQFFPPSPWTWNDIVDGAGADRALAELLGSLLAWQHTWKLNADWLLATATWTLHHWSVETAGDRFHGFRERAPEIHGWVYPGFLDVEPPAIAMEERTSALDDIIGIFLRQPRSSAAPEIMNRLERLLDRGGLIPTPPKVEHDHFAWAVMYQVLGRPYAEIGRAVPRDTQTVTDAVENVARLVDLKLRPPSKGGRPPGSRTKNRQNRVTQRAQ